MIWCRSSRGYNRCYWVCHGSSIPHGSQYCFAPGYTLSLENVLCAGWSLLLLVSSLAWMDLALVRLVRLLALKDLPFDL